jgi:hypothetical protein
MGSDVTKIEGKGNHKFLEGKGAVREITSGKGRYDLMSPLALKRLAKVFERGISKYSCRNWERGMPLSRYVESALRHIFQFLEGLDDEDHLGQAEWNIHALAHTKECIDRGLLPKELNDLPDYTSKEAFERTVLNKVKDK